MVNNPPHLFTLNQIAADYVKYTKKGHKSKMVSRAIIWFNRDVKELVEEKDHWFNLAVKHKERIEELEEKLEQKSSFMSKLFKK